MDDQYNLNLMLKITFQKWMTSTIQFWIDIMLNNTLAKMDDEFWMNLMLKITFQKWMTSTIQF